MDQTAAGSSLGGPSTKREAPPPTGSPTGSPEAKDARVTEDLDPNGAVGAIEGFTLDEVIDTTSLQKLDPTMDIEWETGDFDPEDVKRGKCREINTMIDHGLFEPIEPKNVDPHGNG